MSTRARIGIQLESGTIRSVYCHHDGYLDGVGETLKKHYNKPELVRKLVNLGDFSSLRETIEETEKTCYDEPYRTDKTFVEFEDNIGRCGEEFTYLYTTEFSGVYHWEVAETPYFKEF